MNGKDRDLLNEALPSVEEIDAMLRKLSGDAPERPALLALRDKAQRKADLTIAESDALLSTVFRKASTSDKWMANRGSNFADLESDPASVIELAQILDTLGKPVGKPEEK